MIEKTFCLKKLLKRHFDPSFEMLEKMIQQCPNELWALLVIVIQYYEITTMMPLNGLDMENKKL